MKITKQYHVAPSPTIQLIRQGTLTSVFIFLPNLILYILVIFNGFSWAGMKNIKWLQQKKTKNRFKIQRLFWIRQETQKGEEMFSPCALLSNTKDRTRKKTEGDVSLCAVLSNKKDKKRNTN